ncbi:MFS transporter [Streptomyces sp. ITFR-6]|uniref:MFS transporter n=1 Tax=Streptomyces sp. ITFR-6 TaxID=3075197 RepID=UPI0028899724|nr:MFS transporter [Streptomyces sp. ITFR-6]WNI31243.1 MFS transporter [Streptomyces sp. ITFR-6]
MSAPTPAVRPADPPARPATGAPFRTTLSAAVLVTGFVLLSLNTRVAFGQLGPLAPVAGFSTGAVTLLGLIPPLCMGLFAPLASVVRRRFGEERGLFGASVLLLAGAVVRMLGLPGLFAGTVLVSIATAVVNVLVPVFVRSRFQHRRVGVMMGVYALSMGAGSALVAALTVPVWQAGGHSWELAIGLAVIPAALAAAGIAPQLGHARGRRTGRPGTGRGTEAVPGTGAGGGKSAPVTVDAGGRGLVWSLTAFFGFQTLLFYTTLAWLPAILVDAGVAGTVAGGMQSLFILGVAAGGFLLPVLAAARTDQRPHLAAVVLVCALGYAGLLVAPGAAPALWALVLGAGLGGGQAVAGVLYVKRGRDHEHVAALSAFAQTGGYLLAATGPVAASVLHTATGAWTVPLLVLTGALALSLVASLRAGHDKR